MKQTKSNNTIFISIASYRDPELIPSIIDCYKKSDKKSKLHFGICLQDTKEQLYKLKHLKKEYNINLSIDFHDWRDSQGTCWARYNIQQKLFNDQCYYLQLDSHHRFVEQWDSILIDMMEKKHSEGFDKPIIGGYGPGYRLDNTCDPGCIQINSFDTFTEDGDLIFRPLVVRQSSMLQSIGQTTIPARFLSGHFIFTLGKFCKECIYDPNLYFRGEEISLSARAYTHGYDFFHPLFPIVWHFYLRPQEHKHWDNHQNGNGFVISAEQRGSKAKERVRKLLGMEKNNINFGQYGLGSKRSLHEYELYSGVNFATKDIHKYTFNSRNDSPFAYIMSEEEFKSNLLLKKRINIQFDQSFLSYINPNIEFITLCIEDNMNKLLYRADLKNDDIVYIIKNNLVWTKNIGIEKLPHHCVIIPYYKNQGYGQKINIDSIDYYDSK
jgi:hypothetical protein